MIKRAFPGHKFSRAPPASQIEGVSMRGPIGDYRSVRNYSNTRASGMPRFRLRISTLLWLVAIAAAFLAGIRYGEYRAAARGQWDVIFLNDGRVVRSTRTIVRAEIDVTKNPVTITPATGR
jgi:hypothetical protein